MHTLGVISPGLVHLLHIGTTSTRQVRLLCSWLWLSWWGSYRCREPPEWRLGAGRCSCSSGAKEGGGERLGVTLWDTNKSIKRRSTDIDNTDLYWPRVPGGAACLQPAWLYTLLKRYSTVILLDV